ncbi:MAG: hypothetical protein M1465_02520 [Candidatus Marsarchaeota archaeon]|jgi:hypothetical protein|nr:hypothetical protein [Candidatus Marsarchaeota archaeon]
MSVFKTFESIYIKKPRYIALNAIALVAYYFIMRSLVLLNNKIILFNGAISQYAFYSIAITSSVLVTIAVFSAFNTRNNKAKVSASASGSAIAVAGSFAVSCGCSFSMLSYLAVLGISSGSIISIDGAIATYQTPLILAALLLNVIIIAYYFNKLSKPICSIKSARRRKQNKRRSK